MDHATRIKSGRVDAAMSFREKVWALTARIPSGRVATYGDIGRAMKGSNATGGAARAVGGALGRNPYAPQVPCHRVIGADGRLTGYAGGLEKKRRLLESEGVAVVDGHVDLQRFRCPRLTESTSAWQP